MHEMQKHFLNQQVLVVLYLELLVQLALALARYLARQKTNNHAAAVKRRTLAAFAKLHNTMRAYFMVYRLQFHNMLK